jgi:hypothetical protein
MDKRFEEYSKLYKEFVNIDDFNMEERVKRIPAEKHFWVARLIEAKQERLALSRKRYILKKKNIDKAKAEGIVTLSSKTLNELEKTKDIEDIDEKIEDLNLLIEYLELTVKNISFIAKDIENIIDLRRLQLE